MTEGKLCGLASPGCHSRRFLAGIQGFSLLAFHLCGPAWEEPVDSRLRTSGMTEGEVGKTEGEIVRPCLPRRSFPQVPR